MVPGLRKTTLRELRTFGTQNHDSTIPTILFRRSETCPPPPSPTPSPNAAPPPSPTPSPTLSHAPLPFPKISSPDIDRDVETSQRGVFEWNICEICIR